MLSKRVGALVALAALAAPARVLAADDDLDKLTKAFLDEGAKPDDRTEAVKNAAGVARVILGVGPASRAEVFKDALATALPALDKKKGDAAYTQLIIETVHGLDVFRPYPDLGKLVRGFLKDTPDTIRREVLTAIELHGASGVGKELLALVQENVPKNRLRELLESAAVSCTTSIPTAEAQSVLQAVLAGSRYRGAKLLAVLGLGELVSLRPAKELDVKGARSVLLETALANNQDEEIASASALALLRYDSWDGIAQVMKRFESSKGATRDVYRTLCEAARQPEGFLGLSPERYYEVPEKRRQEVVAEVKLWWGRVKGSSPERAVFEAIHAAGVDVPRDVQSKEAVTALIEGLDLDSRTLRYASLDLLVRRTAKTDLAADFKVLKSNLANGQMQLSEWEPPEGFSDATRRDQLKAQQKQRADVWRKWWGANSARAQLDGGVWVVK